MLNPSGTVITTFVVFAFSFSFGTESVKGVPSESACAGSTRAWANAAHVARSDTPATRPRESRRRFRHRASVI
jgi:hypothetical protein